MVRGVFPVDRELAAEMAEAAGTTLEALGLVPARAAPAPAPASAADELRASARAEKIVDSVVCAASEAMDVLPRAIRPALLAAFTRTRELGLSVESVEQALRGNGSPRREPVAKAKRA